MRIAIAFAASLLASSAFAGTAVPTGHFDGVELRGGGHVTVKHGASQSVTLVKGSTQYTRFHIRDGHVLIIDACDGSCPHVYDLDVEIVTPDLTSAAVNGGGEIVASSGFPARGQFAAAVNGGGEIDMRAIGAATVSAAVHGGGDVHVTATQQLNAAVSGGGDITYRGNPQVNEAVNGGGSVERESK